MLAARESAPGFAVWAFLRAGVGGPWTRTGGPELEVRRSGACGQVPQPGRDVGQQAVAGRESQHQVAGVADQPAGDGDQSPPQGGPPVHLSVNHHPVEGCGRTS
jgi:hypothetical protein